MQFLYDQNGREYLDMFGGIVTISVGHCHPYVVDAVTKQMNNLWHTTNIYMHPNIHEYAEKLTAKLPNDLSVAYFVNSGSEANDLALFLARMSTGNYEILSLQNGYHGMSISTSGLTANSNWRFALPASMNGIHHVKNPDPFGGRWGGAKCRNSPVQTLRSCNCSDDRCCATDEYIDELNDVFKYTLPKGRVAGMFVESIQGVGGTVQFTRDYIKRAAEIVHKNGGVFISDEVQTGFGRTGDHFWGFETHDIVPDIVTMAKGIGNGFPLAAVVTTPKIAQVLSNASHFNTYGGNPMACAAGIAVLEVIEREQLQQNALDVGTYFLEELDRLRSVHAEIGDVRGQGLMIGLEFVDDRETRQPMAKERFQSIWNETKRRRVLFGNGGLNGNVCSDDFHFMFGSCSHFLIFRYFASNHQCVSPKKTLTLPSMC